MTTSSGYNNTACLTEGNANRDFLLDGLLDEVAQEISFSFFFSQGELY